MPNPKPKPVMSWHNSEGTLIKTDLLNDVYADEEDMSKSIATAVAERQRRIRKATIPVADEKNVIVGGLVLRTHRAGECIGYWCPIHNTSPHHMRTWRQIFDPASGVMYRECAHKLQHPDPDDSFEFAAVRNHVKDCDGCCVPSTHITRK